MKKFDTSFLSLTRKFGKLFSLIVALLFSINTWSATVSFGYSASTSSPEMNARTSSPLTKDVVSFGANTLSNQGVPNSSYQLTNCEASKGFYTGGIGSNSNYYQVSVPTGYQITSVSFDAYDRGSTNVTRTGGVKYSTDNGKTFTTSTYTFYGKDVSCSNLTVTLSIPEGVNTIQVGRGALVGNSDATSPYFSGFTVTYSADCSPAVITNFSLDNNIVCNGNVEVTGSSTVKAATIAIETTGSSNSYQWMEKMDGTDTWYNIDAENVMYNVSDPQKLIITPQNTLATAQSRWHKCVVTGCDETSVESNPVKTTLPGKPEFTTHPATTGGTYSGLDDDAKLNIDPLTVAADNDFGGYTWYGNGYKDGQGDRKVGDIDDNEFTPRFLNGETLQYYAIVDNGCGAKATSNKSGSFIYLKTPATRQMSTFTRTLCLGETVTLSLPNPETGVTYGVYEGENVIAGTVGTADVSEAGIKKWTITPTTTGTHTYTIRAMEMNGYGARQMTGSATVTVSASGTAPTLSVDTNKICGEDGVASTAKAVATLSIADYNDGYIYKLFKTGDDESSEGRDFTNATLHTWALSEADTYYVRSSTSTGACAGKSNDITITSLTPQNVSITVDGTSVIDLADSGNKEIKLQGNGVIGSYTGQWSIGDHQHFIETLPSDPALICHFDPNNWNEATWGPVSDWTTEELLLDANKDKKAAYQTSNALNPTFRSEVPSVHDIVWTVTNEGCSVSVMENVEVIAANDPDRDYFISNTTSGYWSDANSWLSSDSENGEYVVPKSFPTAAAKRIIIRASDTIKMRKSLLITGDIIVESGGKLIILDEADGGYQGNLTLDGTNKVIVNGTLENQVSGRTSPFMLSSGGKIEVNAGGKFVLASSPTAVTTRTDIPTITWSEGSQCVIALDIPTAIDYTGLYGGNQAIPELVVDMPASNQGKIVYSFNGAFSSIKDMTVKATGNTGIFQISTEGKPKNSITGNYYQTGGTTAVVCSTSKPVERTFLVNGNFTMTGGKFTVGEYQANISGISRLHIAGNTTLTGGEIYRVKLAQNDAGLAYLRFTNPNDTNTPSTSTLITNGQIHDIDIVSVYEGKTIDIGTSKLGVNNANFAMDENATVRTAHPNGLDEFINGELFQVKTNPGYVFNSTSVQQNTGTKLVATAVSLSRLEVNNAKGVKLSKAIHLNDLTLTSGNLILGDSDLTLLNDVTVKGTLGKNQHVVTNGAGSLVHLVPMETSYTFPVGYNETEYNPITYNNSNHMAATLEVRAAESNHLNSIKAMWRISGDNDPEAGVTITWTAADEKIPFVDHKAYIGQAQSVDENGLPTYWITNESSTLDANRKSYSSTATSIILNDENKPITVGKPSVWYKSIVGSNELDFTKAIWYRSTQGGKSWYNTPVTISEEEMERGDIEKVIISNYSKVNLPDGNYTIKSLRVEPYGKLHTGNGNLIVVDSVLIMSNDESSAQIINTDFESGITGQFNVIGSVRVQKDFPIGGRWIHMSLPFKANRVLSTANKLMTLNSNYRVKYYDGNRRATTGEYDEVSSPNWNDISSSNLTTLGDLFGGSITNYEGYQVAMASAREAVFVADLNENGEIFKEQDVQASLSENMGTGSSIHNSQKGWNLRGNPYTVDYDLSKLNRNCYVYKAAGKGEIGSYDYIIKGDEQSYLLPPFGAFFVQVDAEDIKTDFTYTKEGIEFRSIDTKPMVDKIRLQFYNDNSEDVLRVWLADGAKTKYKVDEDAMKMVKDGCKLYSTTSDGVSVAANVLPREATTIVPLTFYADKTGKYSLYREEDDNAPNIIKLILRDKSTSPYTEVDLLQNPEYAFNVTKTGTNTTRFELEIGLSIDNVITKVDQNGNSGISMSIAGNDIVLHGLESAAKVMIFDLAGRQMTSFKNVNNNESLHVNLSGAYLVKVVTATQTFVQNTFFNR